MATLVSGRLHAKSNFLSVLNAWGSLPSIPGGKPFRLSTYPFRPHNSAPPYKCQSIFWPATLPRIDSILMSGTVMERSNVAPVFAPAPDKTKLAFCDCSR